MSQLDQRIVSASDDGTIRLWNFTMGYETQRLTGHRGPVRHMALTPMGLYLVSAGEDRTVRVWDLALGEEQFAMTGHTRDIRALDVSRDGRWAVSVGDDHALFLWDLMLGERIGSFYADHPLTRCAFTYDGQRLVAADAGGGVHFLRVEEF
jgi:WD40 repeat protein